MFRRKVIMILVLSIILNICNVIAVGEGIPSQSSTYALSVASPPDLNTFTSHNNEIPFQPYFSNMSIIPYESSIEFANYNTRSANSYIPTNSNSIAKSSSSSEPISEDKTKLETFVEQEVTPTTSEVIPESQMVNGYNYTTSYEVTWTAYCLCESCCGKTPDDPSFGVTASGYKITQGINEKVIAVDPDIIPLGSYVYVEILDEGVEDYGYALAADTGGAINNYHVDLYIDGHYGPWYGKGSAKVYIISTP